MVEVTDVPSEQRYVIKVDGGVAGELDYQLAGDVFTAIHTEIYPGHAGQGLANTLVTAVLDELRDKGLRLRPLCPFVKSFLQKHREYADLVDLAKPTNAEHAHADGEGAS